MKGTTINNKKHKNGLNKELPPVLYIWRDLVLYIGKLPQNRHHSIAVDTFSMNLEQNYLITIDEGATWQKLRSVFWPANCPHQSVFNDDVMVFCIMEPTLRFCSMIREKMKFKNEAYLDSYNNEQGSIDTFTDLYNQRPEPDTAWHRLCSLFNPVHTETTDYTNHSLDRRIHAVTALMKSSPGHNHSIQDFARHVNLSVSRLGHLFKQQTNISIARYRMWLRIKQHIHFVGLGRTLTDASIETGFVDAAHFCRIFRYIVGMTPSSFYFHQKGIHVLIADDYN